MNKSKSAPAPVSPILPDQSSLIKSKSGVPSLPSIPKRHGYKANRNKVFNPVLLPFELAPRCLQELGKIPFSHWHVPPIDDYGLACRIGQEYAAHFVQSLKDDPAGVPNNLLSKIVQDIDFTDKSAKTGYWVGFFTELSRYLLIGAQRIDVFKELDRSIEEDEKACAAEEEEGELV
ncbi:hypothetical protein [Nitrosospira multiformis]|nr:hypothetical protein [Nitrosospira multiformis]